MEPPRPDANPQVLSDVSTESHGKKRSHSSDPSQSSEDTVPREEAQPLEGIQMAMPDQDREYGCKFCHKKFTNKQALGGHQNAHKVERAMEKNARDAQENNIGLFGGTSSAPFLASYHRSDGFLNRPFVSWPYAPQQHGIHIGYSSRPGLPMAGEPYASRSLPGFNNVYPGWSPPVPRIPQYFPGHPSYMPNQAGLNLGLSNVGASNSSLRPVSNQGQSTFPGSRIRPDGDPGNGNNNQTNCPGNEQVDESCLDLTLKL